MTIVNSGISISGLTIFMFSCKPRYPFSMVSKTMIWTMKISKGIFAPDFRKTPILSKESATDDKLFNILYIDCMHV